MGIARWPNVSNVTGEVADAESNDVAIPIDSVRLEIGDLENEQGVEEALESEFSIFESHDVVQQMTRSVDEKKRETIAGYFRVSFDPGQRQQVVHIPFCPPLRNAPTVSVTALDGSEATLKTTTSERFGARVEIRLKQTPETEHQMIVEVVASENAAPALGRAAG